MPKILPLPATGRGHIKILFAMLSDIIGVTLASGMEIITLDGG